MALGIAVVGVRGAVVGARLLILPARIATRTLLPPARTAPGERGEREPAARAGSATTTGGELLAAPEIDALGRALAEHQVIERVARPVLAAPEIEDALAAMLDEEERAGSWSRRSTAGSPCT